MTHEEYKQQLTAWAGLTEKRLAALCDEYLPQHFQRTGIVQRLFRRGAAQFTGGQRQHGADTFAAAQQAVAGGFCNFLVRGEKFIAQFAQALLGQGSPGGKLSLIVLVIHCTSSAFASRLASISLICSLAASSVCLQ